jgi:hypothetical protein
MALFGKIKKNFQSHHSSVPINMLWRIRNTLADSDTTTNLNKDDPKQFDLHDVMEDILHNGMRDPFVVSIGTSDNSIRLEEGNRRVKIFRENGIVCVPTIVQFKEKCIQQEGNGYHSYNFTEYMNNNKLMMLISPESYDKNKNYDFCDVFILIP